MKKSTVSMLVAACAVPILCGTLALASPQFSIEELRPSGAPVLYILRKLAKLDLKPDQKTQIASVLKSVRGEIRPEVDTVIEAHKQLFDAIHQDSFDEKLVRDSAKALASAEEQLALSRARTVSQVRAVLTADQKEQLKDLKLEVEGRIESKIDLIRTAFDYWVDSNAQS